MKDRPCALDTDMSSHTTKPEARGCRWRPPLKHPTPMTNVWIALVLLAGLCLTGLAATEVTVKAEQHDPAEARVKEVIVIIKTHFDIGYTHRVKEIVHHYRTDMIDRAMDIMDQSKALPPEQQFAWTGPGWVMSKVLEDWDGQTPARRQRLDDYVKAGKFQFHALPFTLESDAVAAQVVYGCRPAHRHQSCAAAGLEVSGLAGHHCDAGQLRAAQGRERQGALRRCGDKPSRCQSPHGHHGRLCGRHPRNQPGHSGGER
jgi:hypothetical protein